MTKAIEVDSVTKLYGERKAVNEISFNVLEGSIHGFLGPNGAGKSTTMRILAGLIFPDEGEVRLFGQKVSVNGQCQSKSLGLLLEEAPLYHDLTVKEYIYFIAALKRVPKAKQENYVTDCLQTLGLDEVEDRLIENLSKGYKQRVGIAQAIVHKPDIVILDEPTVGLDPQAMVEIRNLILKLKENHTILLSSHLLHEMSLVCDYITIISQGRIIATGTQDEIESKIENINKLELSVSKADSKMKNFLEKYSDLKVLEERADTDMLTYIVEVKSSKDMRAELLKQFVEEGIDLLEFKKVQHSLEDIFLNMTSEKSREE